MTAVGKLRLKKDEDRRLRAGHLWIYSNEIDVTATPLSDFEPGDPVEVEDSRGKYVGYGYVNPRSLIAVRLLIRRRVEGSVEDLLRHRIRSAHDFRESLFRKQPYYRLLFGEGDMVPGLVVDRYGDVLVVQPTTAGIDRLLDLVVPSLLEITGVAHVLVRADTPARGLEGLEPYVRSVAGAPPASVPIEENGVRFEVPISQGQKTGWFYDHRQNRARLRDYVAGRRVLDVFSYIGGWGVQAASFGAAEAVCVDSSAAAVEAIAENARLNRVDDRVNCIKADAFASLQTLRDARERFDIVVLDPPAFIKRKKDLKEGERAYRRINELALGLLAPGGLLVSASCSFHLSREALLRAVLHASTSAAREVQIVEEGHQGPDHPIHPAIPETAYLKAFFVRALDQ